jgi:hypothetical protein
MAFEPYQAGQCTDPQRRPEPARPEVEPEVAALIERALNKPKNDDPPDGVA